jgi:hypothetical protein
VSFSTNGRTLEAKPWAAVSAFNPSERNTLLQHDLRSTHPAVRLRGTTIIWPFGAKDESIDELTRLQVVGEARDASGARTLASAATRGLHRKR